MTTTPAPTELDTLKALEQAATPAPWEPGDPWITAGLMFNAAREVVAANQATHCTACQHGKPVWSGRRDINGRMMAAHVHRMPEPIRPEHYIAGPPGVMVAGNFDYEVGGVINPEDTALIVAMRNALPALLDELAKTRAELDELKALLEQIGPITIKRGRETEHGPMHYGSALAQLANPAATAEPADEPKATCGSQYWGGLRQPGDRPILCTLPPHEGDDHQEPETGSFWSADPHQWGSVAVSNVTPVRALNAEPAAS